MDRERSIELWKQGMRAWNEWAKDMLAQRKKLEENGEWSAKAAKTGRVKGFNEETFVLSGLNEETRAWIEEANVDFSNILFVNKGEYIDKDKETKNSDKRKKVSSIYPDIVFSSFIFPNDVSFGSTEFGGNATFLFSRFIGNAKFINSEFSYNVYFNFSEFGGNALFSLAHFEKLVSFERAEFEKEADFSSLTSEKSFNLNKTKFTQVPDFTESSFHAPPVLDDIEIKKPLDKGWRTSRNTDSRKFRALGKMATEANDNQNAMEFFANEVRAKRGFQDKAFGKGSGRFWWGLLYDFTSDFGRSFIRLFVLWWATTLAFAGFYAFTSKINLFSEALYIAIRQGLVFSGLSRSDRWDSAISALYGDEIPNSASYMMLVQPIISAVWIFLFFLAMRKHFKIS